MSDPNLAEAVGLARTALDACDVAGRALFAANADLAWPDPPHLALWHTLTLLREHRGDGHNAALVAAGIDGCSAHVLAASAGGAPGMSSNPPGLGPTTSGTAPSPASATRATWTVTAK